MTIELTDATTRRGRGVRREPVHGVPRRRWSWPTSSSGVRLGLYEALAGAGPIDRRRAGRVGRASPSATRGSGSSSRPSRASSRSTTSTQPADERRFTLPNAHAHVLLDDDSEACMKPCAAVVPWMAKAIDIMVEEFRSGTGAAFGLFDLHDIQAAFTRPVFVNHLTQNWLPALPDVQAKLDAGEPVRIAEVGCGEGLAAITIARAYPNAEIDGFDLDEASIAVASEQAAATPASATGPGSRCATPPIPPIAGDYDLVMAIEMLHDVPDPVGILRTMKRLAGDARRRARRRRADRGRLHRADQRDGAVLLHVQHAALPGRQHAGRRRRHRARSSAPTPCAATRPTPGFADVEVLDVDHPQFVLYRLA